MNMQFLENISLSQNFNVTYLEMCMIIIQLIMLELTPISISTNTFTFITQNLINCYVFLSA